MNTILNSNLTPIILILAIIGGVYLLATGHSADGWRLIDLATPAAVVDAAHRYNNELPADPATPAAPTAPAAPGTTKTA